jgi:hypothetical protein
MEIVCACVSMSVCAYVHVCAISASIAITLEEASVMMHVQALVSDGMQLRDAQIRMAEVTQKVNAIIGECMEAVSHELTFFPLADCFALFGFDLMVSRDWDVWLLEANADPDFSQVMLLRMTFNSTRCSNQIIRAAPRVYVVQRSTVASAAHLCGRLKILIPIPIEQR